LRDKYDNYVAVLACSNECDNLRDDAHFLLGTVYRDLNASLWKVGWDGRGLARASATIPILFNLNYNRTYLGNQFAVSPDGRHIAFQLNRCSKKTSA
jgi:hypothetical protein